MIDQRLVKKLHKAGFPIHVDYGLQKNPTLEHLIEECGAGFDRLWRVSLEYDGGATKWCATGANDFHDGIGATPTEAVADLWLILHPKV